MKKIFFLFFCLFIIHSYAYAHLCNDVFIQAKDNLAVKVDVRDGQLHISDEARFRVYLLNTMDRDIVDIRLEVLSDEFIATVTPSSTWTSFPYLETKNRGGKKEYFEVKLKRKEGVGEGKYKIKLRLYNGRDNSMIFKTVDIDKALGTYVVPKKIVDIDGVVSKQEWKDALLVTSFYEYVKENVQTSSWFREHWVNRNSGVQTRFRYYMDEEAAYVLVDFITRDENDVAKLYVAKDYDAEPKIVRIDLNEEQVALEGSDIEFLSEVSGNKMEIKIPLQNLGVQGAKTFLVNMTRTQGDVKTYWRGNDASVEDAIVYARFVGGAE